MSATRRTWRPLPIIGEQISQIALDRYQEQVRVTGSYFLLVTTLLVIRRLSRYDV